MTEATTPFLREGDAGGADGVDGTFDLGAPSSAARLGLGFARFDSDSSNARVSCASSTSNAAGRAGGASAGVARLSLFSLFSLRLSPRAFSLPAARAGRFAGRGESGARGACLLSPLAGVGGYASAAYLVCNSPAASRDAARGDTRGALSAASAADASSSAAPLSVFFAAATRGRRHSGAPRRHVGWFAIVSSEGRSRGFGARHVAMRSRASEDRRCSPDPSSFFGNSYAPARMRLYVARTSEVWNGGVPTKHA